MGVGTNIKFNNSPINSKNPWLPAMTTIAQPQMSPHSPMVTAFSDLQQNQN